MSLKIASIGLKSSEYGGSVIGARPEIGARSEATDKSLDLRGYGD